MGKVNIVFQPSGRRGEVEQGITLLSAAQELGVEIEAACGGKGVCGKCRVIVEEGKFEKLDLISSRLNAGEITDAERKLFSKEEIGRGYRLACLTAIEGDLVITVPEESRRDKQVILEKGSSREYVLNPAVKNVTVKLSPASLEDITSDSERLIRAVEEKAGLNGLAIDFTVLKTLSDTIREGNWLVTASIWQDREIIRVRSGEEHRITGLAIDVGTTTLAAYLCDLGTGEMLSKGSAMNPQISYGEDILARISYAMNEEDGLEKLKTSITEAINNLADDLAAKAGRSAEDIDEVVLVYNTAMHHIALGLNPKYIGRSPFTPVIKKPLDVKARELGIKINPAGNIHSLPVEAGFVGPDNVSVLIAEEPYKGEKVRLIIDIGTNGEIDLGNKDRLLSTSCATGPALEGAQIKFGMRAAPGAIERVVIDPDTGEPSYKVIGQDLWYPENRDPQAKGICGSGIIDVIAQMFKAGVINSAGRINKNKKSERICPNESGKLVYVLARAEETSIGKDIVITQADIRAVQLAKAALYVGAQVLMEKYGVGKPDEVTLAGAFGSYINKESAMLLGMFPDCDPENVHAVGNAAGDGARLALLNKDKRIEAAEVASKVEFIETAVEKDFQKKFMDAIAIPHAKDEFVHLKEILDGIPNS